MMSARPATSQEVDADSLPNPPGSPITGRLGGPGMVTCCQVTENEDPAASSMLGVALSTTGVAAAAANASGSPWISIGIVLQAGSEIGPASPPAVSALAPVKPTAPKLVSGSTLQPEWSHEEGASAIHSAELL